MPIGIGTAALVTGLVGAGTTAGVGIYNAHKQTSATNKSATIQQAATDAALEFEKEQARIAKEQADRDYARKVATEDADRKRQADLDAYTQQQAAARQERLAPYQNFGAQGIATLSSLLTPRSTPLPTQIIPNTRPAVYGTGTSAPLSSLAAPATAPAAAPMAPPIPRDGPPPPAIAQSLAALTAQPDPRDPRYAGRLS